MTYVTVLLPMTKSDYPWTVLGVYETTRGIFDAIADDARDRGWTRDSERTNVYHCDEQSDISAVGWWTTLDNFYDELALRDRLGKHEQSEALRAALAQVMVP